MLPDFDENGNLPPGTYHPEFAEFFDRFCSSRVDSTNRTKLTHNYMTYSKMLIDSQVVLSNYMDGSYITSKPNPGDLDIIVEYDALSPSNNNIGFIYFRDNIYGGYAGLHRDDSLNCHIFFVRVYPTNDPRYRITESDRNVWLSLLRRDKKGNDKGIIEFDVKSQDFVNGITGGDD